MYEALVIFVGVYTDGRMGNDADQDALAGRQDSQLLEAFQFFKGMRRQLSKLQEKLPAVGIKAQMLEKPGPRRAGAERWAAVTYKWNRTAAEIQRSAVHVTNDLHTVGILPLLLRADGRGQRGHRRVRIAGKQFGQQVD